MSFRSLWIRLGLVTLLILGALAAWASFGQYDRSVRIQAEIDTLRREADRIERENATLSEKIQFFASPDFKESEAKEKLGLRRQEEKVVAIEGDLRLPPKSEFKLADDANIPRVAAWDGPNYRKWWKRFFKTEPHN